MTPITLYPLRDFPDYALDASGDIWRLPGKKAPKLAKKKWTICKSYKQPRMTIRGRSVLKGVAPTLATTGEILARETTYAIVSGTVPTRHTKPAVPPPVDMAPDGDPYQRRIRTRPPLSSPGDDPDFRFWFTTARIA